MTQNGLLLVNLGSPATPTTAAVKHYLREFLGDPNVVEMPRALWRPILNSFILPFRSPRSAARYRECWLPGGSPQIVYTRELTNRVKPLLPDWTVRMAMTYGQPGIAATLHEMQHECRHITVLPLFPHYTQSTTKSIIDQVQAVDPRIHIIRDFADEPEYLNVLSSHIQNYWDQGNYDQLLIAYHGIPISMVKHGDPYQDKTQQTTQDLRRLLKIPDKQILMAYQSHFGPMPWLQPYLQPTLVKLARQEVRRVLLVVPSFVTDCLETLVEDGIENHQVFLKNGGQELALIPALNARDDFARFIAKLAQRES